MPLPDPRAALATLLAALSLAVPVFAQTAAPEPSAPPPDALVRVARAADDPGLLPWQRDLMRDLARGGAPGALVDGAAPAPAEVRAPDVDDGVWSELVLDSRWSHSVVYDPARDRMVVFGGVDSTNRYLNDLWVLSLAGTPEWHRLEPSGTPPTPRHSASLVLDPLRDRLLMYGGRAGASPYMLSDVWEYELNTSTWRRLTPGGTGPGARYGHTAVYQPRQDRMVVFGGIDTTSAVRNDVWSLELAGVPTWFALTPTGTPPAARYEHTALFDPVRLRMIVHGGATLSGSVNDVWALSLTSTVAWSALTPAGSPPPGRSYHSAVYDAARDRMLVVGGWGSGSWYAYVWALTLGGTPTWSMLPAVAPMPSARIEAAAIYDPVRDQLVEFGGQTEPGGARNDVWVFPLATTQAWAEITPTGTTPDGRNFASAIQDAPNARMVVFGGAFGTGGRRNDLVALSTSGTAVWSALAATGTPPGGRYGHSAIYDPVRARMVVFGGYVGGATWYSNEVWSLTLSGTPAWSQLTPAGTPPIPRAYHSAVYDPVRDRMLVFGGTGFDGVMSGTYDDVWSLALASPTWSQLSPAGTPPISRQQHSAIYDPVRDRMVVFGGENGYRLNDVQALALAGTPTWTALAPTGTPPTARSGHNAIHDPVRDRMVVCGGIPGGPSAETWAMSLAGTPAWSQLAPTSALPDARGVHTGVYDAANDRMIVFGGSNMRNDVWALRWTMSVSVEPVFDKALACLRAPVPNPAREGVGVAFTLPRAGAVRLLVYDVRGRLVRTLLDTRREAGSGHVRWDGHDAAGSRVRPGVYFVRLTAPEASGARKVVLVE